MTLPRIKSLETHDPCTLVLIWENGAQTSHDLKSFLADKPWARSLMDPAIFHAARLAADGNEIIWPGTEIEFSATGLWEDIHPRPGPTAQWMSAEDFREWRAALGYTFAQAASELGISVRMLKYYAQNERTIPKPVWLACMQLAARKARLSRGTSTRKIGENAA